MRWTERQRAMLQEMGLRLWLPPDDAALEDVDATTTAVVDASTAAPSAVSLASEAASATAAANEAAAVPSAIAEPGARPQQVPPAIGRPPSALSPTERVPLDVTALATLDLPALAERAAACTACALCAGRTHSVFSSGFADADWLIVGDAPDDDDDRTGEPFAGSAGQLLDNMLAAIQVTRRGQVPRLQRAYVTPVVKCRPPGRRLPTAEEVRACAPFLRRQIEQVRPRLILAMGRSAAQSLLGSNEAIGKLRGRVHRFAGIPVVVTYHPGYLLRQPDDKAGAWDDLCLALRALEAPTAVQP